MTQTVSKPISVIARCEFKTSGYVLWGIQSGEKTYEVTCVNHTVTGCRERGGEPCKGFQYRNHCKHGDLVQVLEWEHEAAEALRFNPWHGSNYGAERPIDERGSLNYRNDGFRLMR